MNSYAGNYKPSLARRLHLTDDYGLSLLGISLALVGGVTALMAIIAVTIIGVSRPYGRTQCRRWEQQTGYPSKFVVLNWADTGTCLARTPSGKWVLNTKVITFTEGKRP